MTERKRYVWYVAAVLPDKPEFRPGSAAEAEFVEQNENRHPFNWPRRRMYLTSAGAQAQARLLSDMGAAARVLKSLPIEFGEDPLEVVLEKMLQDRRTRARNDIARIVRETAT